MGHCIIIVNDKLCGKRSTSCRAPLCSDHAYEYQRIDNKILEASKKNAPFEEIDKLTEKLEKFSGAFRQQHYMKKNAFAFYGHGPEWSNRYLNCDNVRNAKVQGEREYNLREAKAKQKKAERERRAFLKAMREKKLKEQRDKVLAKINATFSVGKHVSVVPKKKVKASETRANA